MSGSCVNKRRAVIKNEVTETVLMKKVQVMHSMFFFREWNYIMFVGPLVLRFVSMR
jgi:hypothetical protein